MLATLVLLSVGGLALGAALVLLGRGFRHGVAAVDGLALGLLPALVLTRLLPHAFREIGTAAIAAFGGGFLIVHWLRRKNPHGQVAHRATEMLVLPMLATHALSDGAALAIAATHRTHGAGSVLAVAIVLHRLPEGLFLTRSLLPMLGLKRTLIRLGLMAVATLIGALSGEWILNHVPDALFDGCVAFGLGAMLRLSLHGHAEPTRGGRVVSGILFAIGIAIAVAVPTPDDVLRTALPSELSIWQSLGPLFVETSPALLIGLIGAGLIHAWMPQKFPEWLTVKRTSHQAIRGIWFGLPLPICSCGVQPMVRQMLSTSVPTAAIVSLVIATPELGLDSTVLSVRLMGGLFTVARLVASVTLAFLVAIIVAWVSSRAGETRPVVADTSLSGFGVPDEPAVTPPKPSRIQVLLNEAFGSALDHTAAWYLVGLLLAATCEAALDPALVARLGSPLDVIVVALASIPTYVCAQGVTPLAAMLVHKGFSVGAALVLLLVGPSTNLATISLLRRELGLRAAITFAVASVGIAITIALILNTFLKPSAIPSMHPIVQHRHGPWEWGAAGILGGLLLLSLLRQGARGFVGSVVHFD